MKAVLLLKTLSPLTHGAETAGNESIIRREAVSTPVGVRHVPVLTGNSLRHRLLREPIANAICSGGWRCSKEQVRWLFNGGALSGKHPNVDVRRIVRCMELMPHIEALGCSMPDQIVSGKLEMGLGWLACAETMPILNAIVPQGWIGKESLLPSHEFLGRNQYYRHDVSASRGGQFVAGDEADGEFKGMPHGGEHVVPGAAFVCAIHADGLSQMACSAVKYALEEWAAAGATVGGQSSRGHGAVDPLLWTDCEVDSFLFREHLASRLGEIQDFVSTLYTKEAAA